MAKEREQALQSELAKKERTAREELDRVRTQLSAEVEDLR